MAAKLGAKRCAFDRNPRSTAQAQPGQACPRWSDSHNSCRSTFDGRGCAAGKAVWRRMQEPLPGSISILSCPEPRGSGREWLIRSVCSRADRRAGALAAALAFAMATMSQRWADPRRLSAKNAIGIVEFASNPTVGKNSSTRARKRRTGGCARLMTAMALFAAPLAIATEPIGEPQRHARPGVIGRHAERDVSRNVLSRCSRRHDGGGRRSPLAPAAPARRCSHPGKRNVERKRA